MVGVQIILVLALIEYLRVGFQRRSRPRQVRHQGACHDRPSRFSNATCASIQNTLEQLIVFIPALLLFATHVSVRWAFILGLLFLIARAVYALGYVRDPEQRAYGAGLTFAGQRRPAGREPDRLADRALAAAFFSSARFRGCRPIIGCCMAAFFL